uniref:Uncharacterized protein n=1 Tax=Parascaris equorum TaxID=6256 RepID=A0A914RV10_PAREQ
MKSFKKTNERIFHIVKESVEYFKFQHVDSFVALGTTSLSDLRDVYAIGALIIHPDYSPFTASNDIALIQVCVHIHAFSKTLAVCKMHLEAFFLSVVC